MSDKFQQEVRNTLGVSVPGEIVEAAGTYYQAKQMTVDDETLAFGLFARAGSEEPLCVGTGSGAPVGVIVRDRYLTGCEPGQKLPKGTKVTVAIFGVLAVANTSGAEAKFLDDVWVDDTTGAIKFDSTGSVSGATKTHWKVKQGAPDGGIAFITR